MTSKIVIQLLALSKGKFELCHNCSRCYDHNSVIIIWALIIDSLFVLRLYLCVFCTTMASVRKDLRAFVSKPNVCLE